MHRFSAKLLYNNIETIYNSNQLANEKEIKEPKITEKRIKKGT